jgi:GNAT superfamily N-acetyltransferase
MHELVPLTHAELAVWIPPMQAGYVEERIGAGEERESAQKSADQQFDQLFPDGAPAEGQHVMRLVVDGAPVGYLWMGRPFGGSTSTWFVFYVEVDESERGKGFGRVAMLAAEEWTRANGGTRVALNVFGPNTVARGLYDSLGYEVMATSMYKDL